MKNVAINVAINFVRELLLLYIFIITIIIFDFLEV